MKIVFKRHVPANIDAPFGIYEYDETLVQHPLYVDIRGIVRENCWAWLDEVQKSHANVSRSFLRYTRWWWVTWMSRLDVRPWGQEPIVKPLLFSKAVLEWTKLNENIDVIFLIGCDPLVSIYLREFDKTLLIKKRKESSLPIKSFLFACKQSFVAVLKMIKNAYSIGRYHVFNNSIDIDFVFI